jgi:hypothetical protein
MNNGVTKLLANGMTLVGDNVYVKKMYMAIPLRGQQSGWKDGYNFSISQIRITIERAFGVFVHRWSILRAPLTIPILKVPALVETLVRPMTALEGMIGRCVNSCSGRIQ